MLMLFSNYIYISDTDSTSNNNSGETGIRCLVVGAPRVGGSKWTGVHAQLKEAELVADMLRVTPLTDYQVLSSIFTL